jgi:hypothetical protein
MILGGHRLLEFVTGAGFTDIEVRKYKLPCGTWPTGMYPGITVVKSCRSSGEEGWETRYPSLVGDSRFIAAAIEDVDTSMDRCTATRLH